MDKYYKKNYIKNDIKAGEDIEFQIIEWFNQDESTGFDDDSENSDGIANYDSVYTMRCFGVTDNGVSVTCQINNFTPFYYIKVPDKFNQKQKTLFVNFIQNSYQISKTKIDGETVSLKNCVLADKCKIIEKKDLFGFTNNKKYRFIKLVFNNYVALNKSKYIFKNPVIIPGINNIAVKYKLYESNIEPFMRFCHIKDILMAGWIKLPYNKYTLIKSSATTQVEVSINYKDIISLKEKKDIANFLQASWDIETYSHDGTFPDPNKKIMEKNFVDYPNVIYQIGTTFKYYHDKNTLVKHCFTLKTCTEVEQIDGEPIVIIEVCKTEKELIKKWIDLISNMDPDIMYTYNGDTFDCRYLIERAKLPHINLSEYIKEKLTRVSDIPVIIKKETFSSSAYGDSDYIRFYIPGRLNYDLLTHYKRGMKKYPSYKLDFIASEILKEGKHEVTAKDIFKFYEDGSPDKILKIALYCIQDTELLQRLVDKQLILITIIQLANVTFVPIGFLTTRGQTIKVFSQLLRKARQMDYLVPHTNFNEDSYPLTVKSKSEHSLEMHHIGEYITINCGRNTNSYGKLMVINGKISQIIDNTTFIVKSSSELNETESFTAKYTFTNLGHKDKPIINLSVCDDLTDTSFTGATVLTANPGLYRENICVLDFASLYPTIMISRNLCYSAFIRDPKFLPKSDKTGIFIENGITYERIKWDDKIEYTLNHKCEGVGKSGKGKGNICGKQAFFDVSKNIELAHLKQEIENLEINSESTDDIKEKKKITTKIKTKDKELVIFQNQMVEPELDVNRYFCRVHDPIKTSRSPDEKYQKKDVSYDYTIVQPHIDENGNIVNQGVLPALLEELYAERKAVKRGMAKAAQDGDKLLEDILNSTQLAIKVSLNSCYGFLGRGQGNLILKELGSIVTSVGRTLIEQSKEYAENQFLNYIKQNNSLTHKIEYKQDLLDSIDINDKDIILEQFKILTDEQPSMKPRKKVLN